MTTNQLITKIGRQRVLTALSNVVCSSSGGVDDAIVDGVTDRAPSQNAVFDALALKADLLKSINSQTGTTYTLAASDAGKTIVSSNAGAQTITVPLNATVPISVGFTTTVVQGSTGLTSIAAESGSVTINTSSGLLTSPGQNAPMVLQKTGTNTWFLWNGLAPLTWTSFTPTIVGGSGGLVTGAYMIEGKKVTVQLRISTTSNGTTFTVTNLPVANAFGVEQLAYIVNNGTAAVGYVSFASIGITTLTINSSLTSSTWVAAGTKAVFVMFSYQSA